jgi:hypothetical protein
VEMTLISEFLTSALREANEKARELGRIAQRLNCGRMDLRHTSAEIPCQAGDAATVIF